MNTFLRGFLFGAIALSAYNPLQAQGVESAVVVYEDGCDKDGLPVSKGTAQPSVQEIIAVLHGINLVENNAETIAKAIRQVGYDMTKPLVQFVGEIVTVINQDPVFAELIAKIQPQEMIRIFMSSKGIQLIKNGCVLLGDFYSVFASLYYDYAKIIEACGVNIDDDMEAAFMAAALQDKLNENIKILEFQAQHLAGQLVAVLVDFYNIDKTLVAALQGVVLEKVSLFLELAAKEFVLGVEKVMAEKIHSRAENIDSSFLK